MSGSDLGLLVRTAAHLQPSQVGHRIRLRTQAAALRRWPNAGRRLLGGPDPATAVGWPPGFAPLDAQAPERWPRLADLSAGRLVLLGMPRELGGPPDWRQTGAPTLWRHHLHYWDWAWGLAADPDPVSARAAFARLWRSWRTATIFGGSDAWLPYPAAARAWSWCGLHGGLVAGSDIETGFVTELAAHVGFLRRHLESDVGGNHLLKGIKALVGLAVFFSDRRLLTQALGQLTSQLAVQVLPDGGHYERAPAYHCQVLADLVDIADLLRAARHDAMPALTAAIARMRRWLGVVLAPAGQVPMLNDGYPVEPAMLALLEPQPTPFAPLQALPDTGLVAATAGGWHLLADVGPPCPDELPAHAHADTLACLVHVDGAPLLVDTGTSTYAPGAVRDYERSTAAHNTVEVDGASSTEVWGAFRAATRARVHNVAAHADADGITLAATHDGFRRLRGSPVHHRRWLLTRTGLRVEDVVSGRGLHTVAVRWHLAPASAVRLIDATALVTTPAGIFEVTVDSTAQVALAVESQPVAIGFGRTTPAPMLACLVKTALPVRLTTWWRHASRSSSASGRGLPA